VPKTEEPAAEPAKAEVSKSEEPVKVEIPAEEPKTEEKKESGPAEKKAE
jgi:hypothetical protein